MLLLAMSVAKVWIHGKLKRLRNKTTKRSLSMFGLDKVTTVIIGVLTVLLLTSCAVIYWSEGRRDKLVQEKAVIETALTVQKGATQAAMTAVDAWKSSAETLQKSLDAMTENQKLANKEKERLNDIFAKHNLETLAKAKPNLVARRVNAGSASMLRMLESASGGDSTIGDSSTKGKTNPTKTSSTPSR